MTGKVTTAKRVKLCSKGKGKGRSDEATTKKARAGGVGKEKGKEETSSDEGEQEEDETSIEQEGEGEDKGSGEEEEETCSGEEEEEETGSEQGEEEEGEEAAGAAPIKSGAGNIGKGKGKGKRAATKKSETSVGEEEEEEEEDTDDGEEEEEEEAAGAAGAAEAATKKAVVVSRGKRKGRGRGADVAAGPEVPIISSNPSEITSQDGPKRILYNPSVDFEEPLGGMMLKKWGRKWYNGILIEKFAGEGGEGDCDGGYKGRLYRGIYRDGEVHDFPLDKTREAVNNAHTAAVSPDIILEVYDSSVAEDQMGDVVSEDGDGNLTIRYKPSGDGVDFDDPLSMSLATRTEEGKSIIVGMALACITGEKQDGGKAPIEYRVIFRDGKGWVVSLSQVKRMRQLFVKTPGLEPVTVVVRGVNMQ